MNDPWKWPAGEFYLVAWVDADEDSRWAWAETYEQAQKVAIALSGAFDPAIFRRVVE